MTPAGDKPKRIKHPLPDADWPDAATAGSGRWFQPVQLGPRTARDRTWVPAMVPWRATEDGEVTPEVLEWYGRFADGKPGVLVVEATGIRDIPSGPLLRVGHDRFVPGLRQLVETVKERSGGHTMVLLQTIDFLAIKRRPEREKFLQRFLEITDAHRKATGKQSDDEVRGALVAMDDGALESVLTPREWRDLQMGYREEVNDTHLPHIAELPRVLPKLFADAATRAEAAGFDGVELHFAHAYTMASFLSGRNMRSDGYGGSPEHRVRLPLEVLRAVQERVSSNLVVGCRLLGDEAIEGGSAVEDAKVYSATLATGGCHFISVSKGGKFEDAKQPKVGEAAYPYTGPSGLECMPTVRSDERGPFGRNVHLSRDIRAAIRAAGLTTPVVTAGGICTFQQAEEILARGDADIVAAARQSLADPDWFEKIRCGAGDQVRRCIFTNYCEGLDQKHKEVTCQLWDREFPEGEDGEVLRSKDGKRRLVAPRWDRREHGETRG